MCSPHQIARTSKVNGTPDLKSYEVLDLLELVRLVADQSDRMALAEIHEKRRVFRLKNGGFLLLAEYLLFLKDQELWKNQNEAKTVALAERAYDLTMEKFVNLPDQPKQQGTDCRHYFRALHGAVNRSLRSSPPYTRLEREVICGTLFKGLVARQFSYSLLEARREINPFWSRYQWQVDGRSYPLWMPVALSGNQRRAWLEANIPNQVLEQPRAGKHIQRIIDQTLVREHFISLEALEIRQEADGRPELMPMDRDWGISLANYVAQEKAKDIEKQRPAIRKLGPEKLERLVRQVFRDIAADDYEQKRIAAKFGLAPATLSRFAGRNWRQNGSEIDQVPDLWRNTAQVVSQIPMFREVAEEAGIMGSIKTFKGGDHE